MAAPTTSPSPSPPAAPAAVGATLLWRPTASPPPPPMFNWEDLAVEAPSTDLVLSPLMVQLVATSAVVAFVAVCFLGCRCWRRRRLRLFLAGLPEVADDGSWLVVAFEWGGYSHQTQSGKMPMESIATMQDLLAAAVEFGNEVVDAEINEKNVEFHYLDSNGVERRVGAKTRFIDVARARVLKVSRRSAPPDEAEQKFVGNGIARRKSTKKGAGGAYAKVDKEKPTRAVEIAAAPADDVP